MLEIHQPSLAERTTIRLGGPCLAELRLERLEDCFLLPQKLKTLGGTAFVIGAGSNLIASDQAHDLILIRPQFQGEIQILQQDAKKATILVPCQKKLPELLRFCLVHNLAGLENLVGIPGQVGGAIAMNAGAHNAEICTHLVNLLCLTEHGLKQFTKSDFHYSYRTFQFKEKYEFFLALYAIFELELQSASEIKKNLHFNFYQKKAKQPLTAKSAGCVFKNPEGNSAGKLLDLAGLRGYKLGGMCFSDLHANFLINTGTGTSQEAFDLIDLARQKVLDKFAINLELEVRIIA